MKILLPLSWIYGSVMALRNWMFNRGFLSQTSFSTPVLSIGNIAVGGTGKTPHTEYLLQLLCHEGFSCAMLSRGYGRKSKGYLKVAGNPPTRVGDEPWQVQKKFPHVNVYVCEKRVEGIRHILSASSPDVILLDDAYQHRYVKPGFSLLLTDYSRPYYKDYVMPAGRLREFRSGSKRANLILVTKCPDILSATEMEEIKKKLSPTSRQQVFFTKFSYGHRYPFFQGNKNSGKPLNDGELLRDKKVLLLCGIAKPKNLKDYLEPQCQKMEVAKFPDHHQFTNSEIEHLGKIAEQFDVVITTEKDAARLSDYILPPALHHRLWVQPIEVQFIDHNSSKFNKIISRYVTENSRNRKMD